MKYDLPAVTLVLVACLANAAPPRAPKPDHPILGSWTFLAPGTSCEETYHVRPNGTTLVTSAEEVTESAYEIDDTAGPKGLFKMTDAIVKSNGKKDCSGQVTAVGQKSTNYIRFDPSGNVMIMCRDESMNACFGPLRRVRGQAT
ncbi:MAG TPA: hypothetical protein VFC14_19950 [Burkholderiales bacterium]|nr:hypothetical protein [Burkholderiales bacterium]